MVDEKARIVKAIFPRSCGLVVRTSIGRSLYRRRSGHSSGKSNNATCRFRLIYSRWVADGRTLDMQSTPCHLLPSRPDRLTLHSVRENVDALGDLLPRDATLTFFLHFYLCLHSFFISIKRNYDILIIIHSLDCSLKILIRSNVGFYLCGSTNLIKS